MDIHYISIAVKTNGVWYQHKLPVHKTPWFNKPGFYGLPDGCISEALYEIMMGGSGQYEILSPLPDDIRRQLYL